MFAADKNPYDLCSTISEDMHLVRDWLITNSLTLNARKSYYIVFSLKKVPDDLRVTIGNHVLDRKTQGKFLGVILDEKLQFTDHINYLTNKISKLTGLMSKLKTFFPCGILKNLYQSLIQPYYNYCILAWGTATKCALHPLLLYQKRLVRIITNGNFFAHTSPLFEELKILKVEDLHAYHTQLFMYKVFLLNKYPEIKNSILNNQINHNYDTRTNTLRLPYCRTLKGTQNLCYQLSKNWNLLPAAIKVKESLNSFKRECKLHHLNSY